MAKLLIDELNNLYSGDYETAVWLTEVAMQSNPGGGLEYLHKRTWSILGELAQTLQAIKTGEKNQTDVTLKLYRLKLELEEVLPDYTNELLSYIRDPTIRIQYKRIFNQYILEFDENLDSTIQSVLTNYLHENISMAIDINETVLAGETVPVSIIIIPSIRVDIIRLALRLKNGIILNASTYYVNDIIGKYTISLTIPSTKLGVYSKSGVDKAEVIVSAKGFYKNTSIYITSSKSFQIKTTKPRLFFKIPSTISTGENLSLKIISETGVPLKVDVFIMSTNKSVLLNTTLTVHPGSNTVTLNTSNLSEGAYTLIFRIEPFDSYLVRVYSKGFVVTSRALISVEGPPIIIGPPFLVTLNIKIDNFEQGSIVVKSDGRVVAEQYVNATGPVKIQVPLNWVLLKSNKTLLIEAIPADGERIVQTRVQVPVINIFTILLFSILTFSISTVSAQGIVTSLEGFTVRIRRIQRRGGREPRSYRDIIRGLIALLSQYATPPKASETLREYYRRIVDRLSKRLGSGVETVSSLLWRLVLLYEELLYSPRKPDYRAIRRVYDELVRRLRREG
ncbi:MAG: hypothetical protein F7C38_05270 [Desulfurococcales archaeon]|nr:hypothetical protein [Desulfurococcales archaeon]